MLMADSLDRGVKKSQDYSCQFFFSNKACMALVELIAEYWGAHRYLLLCEMSTKLDLKRHPQPLHGKVGGFRRWRPGFSLGSFHLFYLSSSVFEGCYLFVDCSSPIGSFEKMKSL